MALIVGATFAVHDYLRVATIFHAQDGDTPLAQRIAHGQGSVFFGHHADYAALTSGLASPGDTHGFDRATHYLLDTRLMVAWSRALAERGELDAARSLAERLLEFRKPDAEGFFAPCLAPASAPPEAPPFQCEPPARTPGWRSYLP